MSAPVGFFAVDEPVDWSGTVILTTPRLSLRTFRGEDLPLYAALNADPEVARYLGGPLTREDSDDIAAWANHCFEEEGIGLLAVERRADGAFLGMCGLHHQESYPDDVEVGAWHTRSGVAATRRKPRPRGSTTRSEPWTSLE